jgi:uncharacterized protein (DUF58 family)
MIAPRGRLLWLFALVAWPALTLLALVPEMAPVCAFVVGVVAIVAVADAVLSRDRLRTLRIVAPELARFSKGRKGALDLRVANDDTRTALPLRLAISLPPDFAVEPEELRVNVPPQAAVLASFECTPAQRGRFALENAAVQTRSMLGLWKVRSNVAVSTELRVYPDLLAERQHVAAIFLHRGTIGTRPIRRVGKGRDFEQLRDYIAGDSAEDVHWKATAKRGRPVTKVFQVEQTQEVYVIIDASRLSARAAGGAPMLDHFINCALVLCLAAGQRSDLFGLATFSDKVQSFVRAKNGKAHYNLCRDTLYRLQPERVTPDFDDLFTFLRLRLRRRALLVFLTALDDPALAAGFTDKIDLLARQHLVLVNMPRPADANPLFAGDQVENVEQLYRRLGGHLVWNDLRELGTRLHRHGVRLSLLDHASLTPEVIAQYLQVKQRQLI